MDNDLQLGEQIADILMPSARSRTKDLLSRSGRLVHYTTAENALKIIKSRTLWMRNARGMTDFSEVEYGFTQLRSYFQDQANLRKFHSALDKCAQNAGAEAIALFDQWWADIQTNTYICCLSEHDLSEDTHGRLSMWRAFGRGATGVALVLNPPQPYAALPLHVFLSPVAYPQDGLRSEIDQIITNIESNHEFLRSLPRQQLIGALYVMLIMVVVTLKHPGFHEEREWRLIHLPRQFASFYISTSTEIIAGIPQVVRKISLKNQPEANITGIELPQLLDRVIIGPSQYAIPIHESLSTELASAGVQNSANKVLVSGIPLRS